jgi:YesN/AraC family two-component response regulator
MNETKKIRILIAEDDFLVSRAIERTLVRGGYEVVGQAANGEKAVEMTKSLRPDILLMDIQMPRMTGLEAAEVIQRECPTPVVILTAHESFDLLDKASQIGVSAYLTKPPKPQEIERALVIALARHGDLIELRRLNAELAAQKEALEKAMREIKILRGILPICVNCKKIRDDGGFWEQVEVYIRNHSEVQFSHGICPDCMKLLYPNIV